jgi:hypothetical protein
MDLREIGWDGVDWVDMVQNRDQSRAPMNAVLNLRVPWNAGNILNRFTIGGLSRRAQLREWVSDSTVNSLTHSWSWVLLEKPLIVQPRKNFPTSHGTRRFIKVFTRPLLWSLSWATSVQSVSPYHVSKIHFNVATTNRIYMYFFIFRSGINITMLARVYSFSYYKALLLP